MANKYTAMKIPPKEDLEYLYNSKQMSQQEVGYVYGVSQKVIYSWFKKLGINSRIPINRNQKGENNSSWKGNMATYAALHYRVQSARGKACRCEKCGRDDSGIKYDWANMNGDYFDVNDYTMMCRSCHFKKDGHKNNFPNSKGAKNINKRKLIDGR